MLHSQNVHLSCSGWRQKPQGQTFGLTPYVAFSSFMFSVHILQLHIIITYIFFEKCYHCVVKSWPNWVAVGLPCAAPLVVGHESRQLFLSSSESSESGQRLPKINRLSVQPRGWVRVTHHGARSLGLSLPTSKHSASLLHWEQSFLCDSKQYVDQLWSQKTDHFSDLVFL